MTAYVPTEADIEAGAKAYREGLLSGAFAASIEKVTEWDDAVARAILAAVGPLIAARYTEQARERTEALTVWAVPAGYAGGPAGSTEVVPMVSKAAVSDVLRARAGMLHNNTPVDPDASPSPATGEPHPDRLRQLDTAANVPCTCMDDPSYPAACPYHGAVPQTGDTEP